MNPQSEVHNPADTLLDNIESIDNSNSRLPHFCDASLKDLRNHDLRTGSKLYEYALRIYLADSAPLLNRITSGIEAGDADQVRQASHSLKSNSLLVGALRVGNLAGIIEDSARLGEVPTVSTAHQLQALVEMANKEIATRL